MKSGPEHGNYGFKRDYTGEKFGLLTAIEFVGIRQKKGRRRLQIWKFQCECGNFVTRIADTVSYDSKKCIPNCGCYRKKNYGLSHEVAGVRSKMTIYRKGAKRRGHIFQLTEPECTKLFSANCHYCNAPPSNKHHSKQSNGNGYIYNGIDRLDNSGGYTTDNVVTCCWKCNQMKSTFSLDQFLEHVRNIVAHTSGIVVSIPSSGVMAGAPQRRIFEE